MAPLTDESGFLPEQVWDTADIPDRELHLGRPSGSAMPLVWAHAEYVKLRRSLHDGGVFDTPAQSYQRYVCDKTESPHVFWRLDQRCRYLPAGKVLRVEVETPAAVHWSTDNWHTVQETRTRDSGLGIYLADLPTEGLGPDAEVVFTLRWLESGQWLGENFQLTVRG